MRIPNPKGQALVGSLGDGLSKRWSWSKAKVVTAETALIIGVADVKDGLTAKTLLALPGVFGPLGDGT